MGRSNVSSSIFAGLSSPNNRTPRNCPDATATCRTDWIAPPPAVTRPLAATPIPPPILPPLLRPSPTPLHARPAFRVCGSKDLGNAGRRQMRLRPSSSMLSRQTKATTNVAADGGGRAPDNANNIVSTSQQPIQKRAPTCTSLRKGQ